MFSIFSSLSRSDFRKYMKTVHKHFMAITEKNWAQMLFRNVRAQPRKLPL